jgi:hypothetical protein
MNPIEPTPRPRRRRVGCILVGLVAGLLGLVAVGAAVVFVFMGPAAEEQVAEAFARHGATCVPLDVEVDLAGGRAAIGPTTCTFEDGPIETLVAPSAITVDLDGFEPAKVTTASLVVRLRPRAMPPRADEGWLAQVAALAQTQRKVEALLMDAAALSAQDLPELEVGRVELEREGPLGVMGNVRLARSADQYTLTTDQLELHDAERTVVRQIRATLSPDRAEVEADVNASVQVFIIRVRSDVHVQIIGTNLASGPPVFQVTVGM